MSTTVSTTPSSAHSHPIGPHSPLSYTPHSRAQHRFQIKSNGGAWPSQALPLPSNALAAEADAPLNLGLDEEEVVWGGESVGLGFGLLSRIKDKTNALLEAIDWDCRLCGKTATDPCVTRCGHLFCWAHLTKHLASVPLCPKCTSPLAMDRDVVQVFGRPKAIPSDAPWTNANHTPGSRGSAADQHASIPGKVAVPGHEIEEDNSNSIPPPSASPANIRSRSSSSLDSISQDAPSRPRSRRRGLQPLTTIQPARSYSHEHLNNRPSRPPNVLVTSADSDESRSQSRGLSESAKDEDEDDPWEAWRRLSDATAVPSPQTTRRPSAIASSSKESLRPPSPKLRTKSFRPGVATRRSASSTTSFDSDLRQSVEVKFTRDYLFSDDDDDDDDDASGHPRPSTGTTESEDEEGDGNVIYLHSPTLKETLLGLESDIKPEILSPTPKYGFAQGALGLENAASSPLSPVAGVTNEEAFKSTGRKWFAEHRRRTDGDSSLMTPTTTTFNPTDAVSTEDFINLRVAMKDVAVEGEKKKGGMLADPLGRALCVFAVVLLVKILLK